MHIHEQTIQRYLDGELSSAEAQAVQAMLDAQPGLKKQFVRAQAFDELLYQSASYRDDSQQHEQIASIMDSLPAAAPQRKPSFSLAQMVFAACLVICIGLSYGYAGSSDLETIVPISIITIVSLVIGFLLVFMARPLRKVEASIAARFLNWRLNVGQADVIMHRAAGIAIILGGAYLMIS
jgi:hypothetical protein